MNIEVPKKQETEEAIYPPVKDIQERIAKLEKKVEQLREETAKAHFQSGQLYGQLLEENIDLRKELEQLKQAQPKPAPKTEE